MRMYSYSPTRMDMQGGQPTENSKTVTNTRAAPRPEKATPSASELSVVGVHHRATGDAA